MQITSLFCPCVGGEVPPDHYTSGKCTKSPAPLPWLLATIDNAKSDTTHCDNRITATRLSACPRKTGIEDNLPIYAFNLMRRNSMMWGVAMHLLMEKYSPKGFLSEIGLKGTLFKGTDVEIEVGGTADLIRPGVALLQDYKGTSETNQRYLTSSPKARLEWSIQFSIYKILDDQGPTPHGIERGAVWNGSLVSKRSKAAPWVEIPVTFMREDEILAAQPFEGNTTVQDHLLIRQVFLHALEKGVPVRDAVSQMPLTGMDMAKFICDYCEVSHICMHLAGHGEI